MTRKTFRSALVAGALVALVGFAQGARVLAAPEGAPPAASGEIQSHPTQGTFWRPADSIARRPPLQLAQRHWQPESVSHPREFAAVHPVR